MNGLPGGDRRRVRTSRAGLRVARRLRRDRRVVVGSAVLGLLVLGACAGPSLSPWGPGHGDLSAFGAAPSARHWLGTDPAGRDVYTATLRGLRGALLVGPAAAVVASGAALLVGGIGGYLLGGVDRAAGWLVDLLLALPSFLVAAVVWPMLGRSWGPSALVIGGLMWMTTAKIVRALTVSLRECDYVRAARYMGVRTPRICATHLWPRLRSVALADATLNVGTAVLAQATLCYLDVGAAPDGALGTLLAEASSQAFVYPWLFAAPAGCLILLVLAVQLLGEGLRDVLAPDARLRAE